MTERPKRLTPEEHLRVAAHLADFDQIMAEARATMTDSEYDGIMKFLSEMLDDIKSR